MAANKTVTALPFDGGSETCPGPGCDGLVDDQVAFYQIDVPATLQPGNIPLAGWTIRLDDAVGASELCVRKDSLPDFNTCTSSSTTQLFDNSTETNLVAPVLTPGQWFIGVRGVGLTEYTVSSLPLVETAAYDMPQAYGDGSSFFGDSGEVDLEAGRLEYYKVTIEPEDASVLRTQLEAISGNPDIYLRVDAPPTLSHDSVGRGLGTLFDRSQTGTGTNIANWVPLDLKSILQLTPGDWWIAVRATTSNARYRLRLSAGNVTPLVPAGGAALNQVIASGDTRYYRFAIPQSSTTNGQSVFEQWTLNLEQIAGDVVVFLREIAPPGQGTSFSTALWTIRDWSDDNTNITGSPYQFFDAAGDHVIDIPPLEPGKDYFVGVFAKSDSVFSLRSSVSTSKLQLDQLMTSGQEIQISIPAGERRLIRVDIPATDVFWQHSAEHTNNVSLYLHQGTRPPEDTSAHR